MALACLLLAGCAEGFPRVIVKLGEGDTTAADVLRPVLIATDAAEARAVGARILGTGGTAGDAAAAVALALAVTLPSSAGLGARGICLAHDTASGRTAALDFTAFDLTSGPRGARSPACPRSCRTLRPGAAPRRRTTPW